MARPVVGAAIPGRVWSLGWVVALRCIMYLVIIAFLLQYMYFSERGIFYRPDESVAVLVAAFLANLGILLAGVGRARGEALTALTYVVDIAVVTRVVLTSGGFNSVLIPIYFPILFLASVWLPRKYTAVFPSIATLGIAYIDVAHLLRLFGGNLTPLFNPAILDSLGPLPHHTIVSIMLVLTVLFFVVSYFSGMISDKLLTQQRLNAEILASMNDGVAVVDRSGTPVYVNDEFLRLFPDAAGKAGFAAVSAEIFESGSPWTPEDFLNPAAPEKTGYRREMPGDGERPPLEVKLSGLRVRGGSNGLIIMATDLSLRKRVERAERSLERSSAVSIMAAGLAHEIRNPLASLRGAIQEIGAAFPEDSQNRLLAGIVISESDRLDGIIGRFLDFSREGVLRPAPHRLGEMLATVKTMLQQSRDADSLRITVTAGDDPEVVCDGDRVKQVFINLGLNAAQAAPAAGGELQMLLRPEKRSTIPGVLVEFRDNGPGIPEEALGRLFEPFYSNRQGGTGLGLPLSRKEVLLHGGEIDVQNAPGGGALFRVWLPLVADAQDGGRRLDTRRWMKND